MGSESPAAPKARVVLLGASNLARGISSAIEAARTILGEAPLEFLVAMGHGRSYGEPSRVLGRTLPGVAECGLWEVLGATRAPPTYALVTDIGNDVAYGVPVATIADWVDACLERLQAVGARCAMSRLPVKSIESLGPRRYRFAKAILFPGRSLTLAEAQARTRELDGRLGALAGRRGVRLVEQRGRWYGFDPLHVRLGSLPEAWAAMMAPWADGRGAAVPAGRGTPAQWLRLRLWRPAEWSLLGWRLGRPQPSGRLPDDSPVSLY